MLLRSFAPMVHEEPIILSQAIRSSILGWVLPAAQPLKGPIREGLLQIEAQGVLVHSYLMH